MKRLIALAAVLAACALRAAPDDAPFTVKIDPSVSAGAWEGWGTSLAWWANVFGDRADLADLFFSRKTVAVAGLELPGLGLNIARYNLGACSWNTLTDGHRMVVSKGILPFRQIDGFWLNPRDPDPASKSWDWSVDARQRRMLVMARDRGADRFELFSNSPMWWMTKNDNPSGAADGGDNIAPAHYRDFALYLAAVARHAKDAWGVSFTSVDPFNEPSADWWKAGGRQEGAHVSPASQMKILPLVRAAFDAQGLRDVALAASDESLFNQAVKTWQAFTPAARALVDKVNVHGYQGDKGPRDELYQIVRVRDGKDLWNSEHGEGDASGLTLAREIHLDLAKLHPSAWVYWQVIDGGRAGQGGSGWGFLDAKLADGTALQVNPKYYVMAQYSRHIRPGMTLIGSGNPDTLAALDTRGHRLALVTFNPGPAREITYDLSAFALADGPASRFVTEPKGAARYERRDDLRIVGHRIVCTIPAESIQSVDLTLSP